MTPKSITAERPSLSSSGGEVTAPNAPAQVCTQPAGSAKDSELPPVVHDSTDEDAKHIKDKRKRPRPRKTQKKASAIPRESDGHDTTSDVEATQASTQSRKRFPWTKYKDAEKYLFSRFDEFHSADSDEKLEIKKQACEMLVKTWGPFKGFIGEEIKEASVSILSYKLQLYLNSVCRLGCQQLVP